MTNQNQTRKPNIENMACFEQVAKVIGKSQARLEQGDSDPHWFATDSAPVDFRMRSLADIERIVEIEAENETLKKTKNAQASLIKSLEKVQAHLTNKDYSLSEGNLKSLESSLESEREMNAELTEENERRNRMIKITGFGQLSIGDRIKIIGKSERDSYKSVTVKDVLNKGRVNEEVIINKRFNHYFITNMLINGGSWAVEAFKQAEGE
ncbi:hypothetical protein ACOI22_03590 [Glaciecola sp. 2405UD65-10]|uniref:hypothetical protein n=1 Tax=Glaciecola sp. 2405UD65-10 TaxID=3397244 RepID=UPI003B5A9F94